MMDADNELNILSRNLLVCSLCNGDIMIDSQSESIAPIRLWNASEWRRCRADDSFQLIRIEECSEDNQQSRQCHTNVTDMRFCPRPSASLTTGKWSIKMINERSVHGLQLDVFQWTVRIKTRSTIITDIHLTMIAMITTTREDNWTKTYQQDDLLMRTLIKRRLNGYYAIFFPQMEMVIFIISCSCSRSNNIKSEGERAQVKRQ